MHSNKDIQTDFLMLVFAEMKSYKYKLRPSKTLIRKFESTLDICRELYNAALEERSKAWRMRRKNISYYDQCAELTEVRAVREDVAMLNCDLARDPLRRAAKAFDGFFRRVKAAQKPGYPRFQNKQRYNSFTFPTMVGSSVNRNKINFSKLGSCRFFNSRKIEGKAKTVTVKCEADGWYVIFAVEENQCPYIPRTGDRAGVDVGIENFATISTGEIIENPQYLRVADRKLKTAHRSISRKKKQSKSRKKAIALLAKQHQQVQRQRRDFCFKTANGIIKEFDEIAIEDLKIENLKKNHHLAKSIADASWGTFIEILTFKAESAGRIVWKVAPQFTSQDCSQCGNRMKKSLATAVLQG